MKGANGFTRGFTLIEMLVALAVGAILLALAVPSVREITANNQRAGRVNELVTDFSFARAQALSLRQQVVVCRTSTPDAPNCGKGNGWEEGWVVFIDKGPGPNDKYDSGEVVLRRHEALISVAEQSKPNTEKFTLRGNGLVALGTVRQVIYSANGLSDSTGTIMACDLRNKVSDGRAIIVAKSGRVRTEMPGKTATCQR